MISGGVSLQKIQSAPLSYHVLTFFSVTDDTNGSMLRTAYGAAGIALGAAAIVVLLSTRSFVISLFSILTIGFILTSVTAILVGIGWTLGL